MRVYAFSGYSMESRAKISNIDLTRVRMRTNLDRAFSERVEDYLKYRFRLNARTAGSSSYSLAARANR